MILRQFGFVAIGKLTPLGEFSCLQRGSRRLRWKRIAQIPEDHVHNLSIRTEAQIPKFDVKSEKNKFFKASFESTLSRPTDSSCTASREDSKIVSGNQKGKVSTGASSSSRARPRRWRIAERTPVRPDNLHPADTKN